MRIKVLILGLICFFFISCDNSTQSPFSPEPPEPIKPASISLGGWNVTFSPRYWDWPNKPPWPTKTEFIVTGNVYNSGDLWAKNVKLVAKIYDSEWNILWSGEYLIANGLGGNDGLDFEARWSGLDIAIFCELDENGKPLNERNWDYNKTLGGGMTVTWE